MVINDRKRITRKDFVYTCIKIFDDDKIDNYFTIDKTIFKIKYGLINKEICALQYPKGGELLYYLGKIIEFENDII